MSTEDTFFNRIKAEPITIVTVGDILDNFSPYVRGKVDRSVAHILETGWCDEWWMTKHNGGEFLNSDGRKAVVMIVDQARKEYEKRVKEEEAERKRQAILDKVKVIKSIRMRANDSLLIDHGGTRVYNENLVSLVGMDRHGNVENFEIALED